ELELGAVGGLGVLLDRVVEGVDLGGDLVGLSLLVADLVGGSSFGQRADDRDHDGRCEQGQGASPPPLDHDHGTRTVAKARRLLRTGDRARDLPAGGYKDSALRGGTRAPTRANGSRVVPLRG